MKEKFFDKIVKESKEHPLEDELLDRSAVARIVESKDVLRAEKKDNREKRKEREDNKFAGVMRIFGEAPAK